MDGATDLHGTYNTWHAALCMCFALSLIHTINNWSQQTNHKTDWMEAETGDGNKVMDSLALSVFVSDGTVGRDIPVWHEFTTELRPRLVQFTVYSLNGKWTALKSGFFPPVSSTTQSSLLSTPNYDPVLFYQTQTHTYSIHSRLNV